MATNPNNDSSVAGGGQLLPSLSINIDEKLLASNSSADTVEKKEQIALQWLASVERELNKAAATDHLKVLLVASQELQQSLLKQLYKFITSPLPKPSRPIRQIIARIYVTLFEATDSSSSSSRSLFDCLASLHGILNQKKLDDAAVKIAAIHCVGVVTDRVGSKVMSLFAETATIYTKVLKAAKEADIPLRFETLKSLARAIKGCGKAASDATLKEAMRLARAALGDKSFVIRSAGAELLEMIYRHSPFQKPVKHDEFETLLTTMIKSLEASNSFSRRAISNAAGFVLSLTQQPKSKAIPPKPPAKGQTAAPINDGASDEPLFTIEEALAMLLSNLIKASAREVKIGIFEIYAALFRELGLTFVENNYLTIMKHIVSDLAANPKLTATEFDASLMREMGAFLSREILGKMLPESSQIIALRDLTQQFLKRWSSSLSAPIDAMTSMLTLIFVLQEIASLITELGAATTSVEDVLYENLTNLISHPSQQVTFALSHTLKCFCHSQPRMLTKVVEKLILNIQKEYPTLTSDKPEALSKFMATATCLSAVISVIPTRSLHASFETAAIVFGISTQLLKAAGFNKDAKVANVQVHVSWSLLGSLMTLGHNFVRVHISQLLLMWKQVFPKPTGKDGVVSRGESEWLNALLARECALTCIQSFLLNNQSLVTIDVAKRIVVCLNNCVTFLTYVPVTYPCAATNFAGRKKLVDLENTLKRRLLSCFLLIKPISCYDTSYEQLIKLCVLIFAPDPEQAQDRGVEPPVPSTAKVVAGSSQGYDLGLLTSLIADELKEPHADEARSGMSFLAPQDNEMRRVETLSDLLTTLTIETDPGSLYISQHAALEVKRDEPFLTKPVPLPAQVAAVDVAIKLFGALLPLQSAQLQENTLESLIRYAKYSGPKVTPARKAALQLNVTTAVMHALRTIIAKKGGLASERVPIFVRDLVEDLVNSSTPLMRGIGCDTLGLLCRVVSTGGFINQLMQNLVDSIVNNRDPNARAGASLALGCIHSQAGGMAVGAHLKTTVGILQSLAADAHPLVHTWALYSLWLTIESAGLMFGPFVNSTLSLVTKIMMLESHDLAASGTTFTTTENNLPILPTCGKILHALVGVLGPELQSSSRVRELCFSLFEEFKSDSEFSVVVEAIKCIQQFILFAPKHVDVPTLIPFLQLQLVSGSVNKQQQQQQTYLTRKASVTCLYQLTRKDPGLVLSAAVNRQLEEQLFALLDIETDLAIKEEIKDILVSLLKHVSVSAPSRWLDLCKGILAKGGSASTTEAAAAPASHFDDDDEGDEDAAVGGKSSKPATPATQAKPAGPTSPAATPSKAVVLLPRWQTQVFALSCLREVLAMAATSGKPEHLDMILARAQPGQDFLVLKVADLIRMAFNSATAPVHNLRLEGLHLLQDVLQKFAKCQDPDFEGHPLLEQYQAQINAAIAPAFGHDSSPQVTSVACRVLAAYIGSGINQDLLALGRVLKLLSSALDIYKSEDGASPTANMCFHEKVMLKLAVLTAWAELFHSSEAYPFLKAVVDPNLPHLAKLWVTVLRDYAKIKVDVDMSSLNLGTGAAEDPSGSMNSDMYVAATCEVLSPYYQRSWLIILKAYLGLMQGNEKLVLETLASFKEAGENSKMAFVIFGLCIESITNVGHASSQSDKDKHHSPAKSDPQARTQPSNLQFSLLALKLLLHPKILRAEELTSNIFIEFVNVLDRICQVEETSIQAVVATVLQAVITNYGVKFLLREDDPATAGDVSKSLESLTISNVDGPFLMLSPKLYAVFKWTMTVLTYHVPTLSNDPVATVTAHKPVDNNVVSLFTSLFEILTTILCDPILTDRHLSNMAPMALFVYSAILSMEKFSGSVAPKLIISLKLVSEQLEVRSLARLPDPVLVHAVQALLSTLLDIVDSYWEENALDVANAKNPLLASVILVSSAPRLSYNLEAIERHCDILLDMLNSKNSEASLLALQCIRSIVAVSTKNRSSGGQSTTDLIRSGNYYLRLLMPRLVSSLLSFAADDSPSESTTIDESIKALTAMCAGGSPAGSHFMKPVVSVLVNLLSCKPSGPAYKASAVALLQLATQEASTFKEVIQTSLDASDKVKLETAFKSLMQIAQSKTSSGSSSSLDGRTSVGSADTSANATPRIKLMSFGSS